MKRSFIICFFIIVALDFDVMFGQNTGLTLMYKLRYDSVYGTNPHIYQGIKYFPEHTLARGFPYWKDDKPLTADVVFSGKCYKDLKIKYNIYNQEFILEFSDKYGSLQQVVMNRMEIDSVLIDDVLFVRNRFSEIKTRFLQVIYEGNISCYLTWKKDYRFDNSGVDTGYEFSNAIVTCYIVREGKPYVFTNKRRFLKIFPSDKKNLIRKFIKNNKIKVKRKIQADMVRLCIYCDKLVSQ